MLSAVCRFYCISLHGFGVVLKVFLGDDRIAPASYLEPRFDRLISLLTPHVALGCRSDGVVFSVFGLTTVTRTISNEMTALGADKFEDRYGQL